MKIFIIISWGIIAVFLLGFIMLMANEQTTASDFATAAVFVFYAIFTYKVQTILPKKDI